MRKIFVVSYGVAAAHVGSVRGCGGFNANGSDTHTDAHSNADSDTHTDAHSNADSDTHTDAYSDTSDVQRLRGRTGTESWPAL